VAIDRDQAAPRGTDNEAMGSPNPSSGIRRRLAVRTAVAFGLVGLAWVAGTDLFIIGFRPEEWTGAWGRTANRAVYVSIATVVVYLVVRSLERRSERAEASVHAAGVALARSEERYRSLVERVPGVVWLNEVDRDDPGQTRCVYIAPQLRDLLGCSPEEWIADPDLWERVIHPDDRPGVAALNDRADDTGSLSMEYRAIHRDGRVVWIHDEAVLIPAGGDRPAYWQGVMVDITPQRVADRGIHELAASLRAVFAASPVAIIVLELDGRVRHWNPAAERTFGWSASEVVGQLLPYVPEDARREFDEVFERARSGGGIATFETERLHKQGHRVSVAVSTAPLLDPDGSVGGVLSVLEDITERTRIADELETQAEMLANVSDAVIASDEQSHITYWSPGAEALYGWTPAEAIGQDSSELLRIDLGGVDVGDLLRSFLEHGFWQGEIEHRRKDGGRVFVDSRAVERRRADGSRYFLSVNRDVSDRHAAQEALSRRARQQEVVDQLALVALEDTDLDLVLREACALVASTLGVVHVSVLEALPERTELLLRALAEADPPGGEPPARPRVPLDPRSLDAHALDAEASVVVDDFRTDWRFGADAVEAGIVSGVACVVSGTTRPFGILKVLADRPQAFRHDDVRFLEGISAIVGLAIERDAASSALRRAEERYRVLVEAGPGVVYIHDPDEAPARLRYVSPQVVDLLGYPREEWIADPMFWTRTIHPDDLPRLMRADADAIANESSMEIEYRMVHRDGRELWVQDRAEFVRDDAGGPLFRQGLIVDVTERRRAEEDRRLALEGRVRLAARLELLHQIDRDVLSATTIDEMAERTLDHLGLLVPFDRGSVIVIDPDSQRFAYAAVRQAPDLDTLVPNLESHPPDAAVRETLATDALVRDLNDLAVRTPHMEAARRIGLRSGVLVALRADGEQLGVLILVSRQVGAFDEEAFDIAKEVGAELAIAIRQTHLRQALAKRAEELGQLADERRQMLHRIVRAQEEERGRVAFELHDGLGQVLTSISLFASDLEQDVPAASRARAARVNELVRRAIVDSRQLVWSLRPPELERLGLVAALRRLCEEVSTLAFTIDLHEEIGDLRLLPETEAVVYRVVQEAVHNAQKHSGASAVSILLQRLDGTVTTIVEDNGSGFDAMAVPPGRGLGLIGMRERAELVAGALVVESSPEAGTRVRLEVPFESTSGRGGNDS
jgi:PAS domain S-box-containing protein